MLMQPEKNGMPFDDDAAYIKASSSDTTTNTSQEPQEPQEPSTEIEDYLLDMTCDVVAPEFRFKIGAVEFCPSGGITAVSGLAKQGKTQFLLILAATILSGREFGNLQRENPCKSLLWIDTEQSKYDIQSNMKRLYQLADISEYTDAANIGLYVAHLRDCTPEQRKTIVCNGVAKYEPDMLVIDGIRDLLHNFNDESESEDIIQLLLTICAEYPHTNIFCVLHNNPSDNKMRGHLGSELLNKCTDRFIVKKEEGYFKVEHQSRHMELQEDFKFRFDERGQLVPFDGISMHEEKQEGEPEEIIESIFAAYNSNEMYWNDLVTLYAERTKQAPPSARQAIKNCNQKHKGKLLQKLSNGKYKLFV